VARWPQVARRIRVPAGFVLAAVYLWLARPNRGSILLGLFFIVVGLVLRGLASGHVQKNEELATSGPYAYTRNPLYLGSFILALGFTAAARSLWIAIAVALLLIVIYLPVIRAEEEFLRARFPGFEKYARRVPRFFPSLSPAQDSAGAFSWALYRKHHEYNATVGAAAMVGALIVKMHFYP